MDWDYQQWMSRLGPRRERITQKQQSGSSFSELTSTQKTALLHERYSLEESVVGMKYSHDRLEACRDLSVGDKLYLTREPENSHDENAIRVETKSGLQIGYLPSVRAQILAPVLDKIKDPLPARIIWIDGDPPDDPHIKIRFSLLDANSPKNDE